MKSKRISQSQILAFGLREVRVEEFARKAGLQRWYDCAYRPLSRAVHTRLTDLLRYVVLDKQHNLVRLRAGSSQDDAGLILSTAGMTLLIAVEELAQSAGRPVPSFVAEAQEYFARVAQTSASTTDLDEP